MTTFTLQIDGKNKSAETNNTDNTFSYDANFTGDEGKHTITVSVQDTAGKKREKSWDITLPEKPSVNYKKPSGAISNSEPTVKFTVKDPSGINTDSFSVDFGDTTYDWSDVDTSSKHKVDGEVIGHTLKLDPGELNDDDYKVHLTIKDGKGTERSENIGSFTVDTKTPTLEDVLVGGEGGEPLTDGTILTGDTDLYVKADDNTTEVEELTVELGDYDEDENDEEHTFSIDTTELANGEHTLYIQATDTADNEFDDDGKAYKVIVDNQDPVVKSSSLEVYPDPTNSAPELSGTASDGETQITAIWYNVNKGDTIFANVSNSNELSFTREISVDSLNTGEHTVTVWATDEAGHDSPKETINFTYDPSLTASLTIPSTPHINITQGHTESYTASIRNTGAVPDTVRPVIQVNTDRFTPVITSTSSFSLDVDETQQITFELTAANTTDVGTYNLTLAAQGETDQVTRPVTVTVRPNAQTKQEIKQRYEELNKTLHEVKQKYEELDEEDVNETVESMTGRFVQNGDSTLQQGLEAALNGDYVKADSRLDDLQNYLTKASENVETLEQQHEQQQTRNMYITLATLLFLIIAGGAYLVKQGKHDFAQNATRQTAARTDQLVNQIRTQLAEHLDQFTASQENESDDAWTGYSHNP